MEGVACDDFSKLSKKVFLLTHAHADHMVGLDNTFPNIVFCSEVTARLLRPRFENVQFRVLPMYQMTALPEISANVLAIPANHCPGAIQFKVIGSDQRVVLYTGDMRLHPMMLKEKHLAPDVIDELVLDCTFCSHAHSSFPSKEESVALFVELIKKHPSEQVFIELDMLGTEMFVSALQRFCDAKQIHCVSEKRRQELTILGFGGEKLTEEESESRFHIVPFQALTKLAAKKDPNYLLIKPSTQFFSHLAASTAQGGVLLQDGVYHILYSIHSSFSELCDYVGHLRPRKITPHSMSRTAADGAFSELKQLCRVEKRHKTK